ncbi:MAG TPA: prepilin peptidase [Micropepsaceae bacterium]|nr:prepilin peptidase [Micropepsaceae bacterium]
MTLATMIIATLPALLMAAAFFDLTTYTIPNALPAGMFLLFVIFVLAMALAGHSLSWRELSPHLLAGAIGLVAGMVMFALRWVGGGDAKLFAMACLWLGWDAMFNYAVIVSILGGALTLGLLMLRQVPLPKLLAEQPWLMRLADPQSGVPYGVALAIAALNILPNTEIFRLAAAS